MARHQQATRVPVTLILLVLVVLAGVVLVLFARDPLGSPTATPTQEATTPPAPSSYPETAANGSHPTLHKQLPAPGLPLPVLIWQKSQSPAKPKKITYTVHKGDNLTEISLRYHLMGYNELYRVNKGVIGINPNLIWPGEVLVIPA